MTAFLSTTQNLWVKLSDYLNKNYQCIIKEPKLFTMRKAARFEAVRDWVSHVSQTETPAAETYRDRSSIFAGIDVDAAAAALKEEGLYQGFQLPAAQVEKLLDFARSTTCYANRDPNQPFRLEDRIQLEAELGKPIVVASYMDSHVDCPAFQTIRHDPVLLAIAARYLGAEPAYMTSEMSWSFPTSTSLFEQLKAAQVFHYDIDDYRSIKFFFYLTDVDAASGPHICLSKTHRNKTFLHQFIGQRCASIPDQALVDAYGSENVVTLCGGAGFGFVEDTFCFHKGSPPQRQERLLLQLEFGISRYKHVRLFETFK